MSVITRKLVVSESEGVQCELGCEAYRNCKPLCVNRSHTVDILLEQPSSCVGDTYNVLTNANAPTRSPQLVCSEDHCGLSESLILKSMEKIQDVNKKQNATCVYVSYLHEGFICGFCGQGHENVNALEVHCRSSHDDVNPFKCHKCDQSYQTWSGVSGLKAHLSCHLPVCDQPDTKIPNSVAVTSVLGTEGVFTTEEEPSQVTCNVLDLCELVCGECGLQFVTPRSYEIHCMSHHLECPFKCVECEQRFSKRIYLEEHKASHLLIKPHVCEDCGALFSFKWSLLMHSRVHGSVSNYPCGLCEKQFLLRKYLTVHQQSHLIESTDLPSVNSDLDVAQQSDVDDEPNVLKCFVCGEQFSNDIDFNSHLQQHRNSQFFKCVECEFVSDKFVSIQEHVNSSHDDMEVHWCADCGGSGSVAHDLWEINEFVEGEVSEECSQALGEEISVNKETKSVVKAVIEKDEKALEITQKKDTGMVCSKKGRIKQRKRLERGTINEESPTWQVHLNLKQEKYQKTKRNTALKTENSKKKNVKQRK